MSSRPGRIIDDIPLNFERPRHAGLVTSSEFSRLKRHCLAMLHPQEKAAPLARFSPLAPATRFQFAM